MTQLLYADLPIPVQTGVGDGIMLTINIQSDKVRGA